MKLIPKYLGKISGSQVLFSWQFYNLLKFGSVIFTAILMAKFIPDLQQIKTYENLQLLATTLSFFYISGLGQTVIPFYENEKPEDKKTVFHRLFFLLSIFALITSSLIALYAFVLKPTELPLYLLFAVGALFNIPTFALESYLLAEKQSKKIIQWGAFSFSLQIVFFIAPAVYTKSLTNGILGATIFALIKFIVCVFVLNIKTINIKKESILSLLKYSYPVLLSFLIGGSYVHLNAFIVELNLSDKDFVLYRFGAREFPLFLIIANSFSLVYSAKIASANKAGNLQLELKEFKQQNKKVLHQLFPLAIVLMLISKPVFAFLYSAETADAYLVFNILLLLLLFRVLFPQTILFGLQKNKVFIVASTIELIAGITLSLWLVKPFGLQGVCWAMVIAFLLEKVFLIGYCYRNNIPFFKHFPLYTFLIYSTLLLLTYVFTLNF